MLVIDDLRKQFGSLEVTRGVSLRIGKGERHAVIGPNGAGKTTLFNLVCGEIAADGGRIELNGTDITRLTPDRRARLGLARSFQRNSLFPALSVAENLALAAAVHRRCNHVFWRRFAHMRTLEDAARVTAERLGLMDNFNEPVGLLSYGTQRQVEVGLALITEPKILMLDEPTAGMSPEETVLMKRVIAELPDELAVLIIEHDMDVVFDLASTITVLDYGEVLLAGSAQAIRESAVVRERYLGAEDDTEADSVEP